MTTVVAESSGRFDLQLQISLQKMNEPVVLSRSYLAKLIRLGLAKINEKTVIKPSELVRKGDQLAVHIPENVETTLVGDSSIDLDIRYEDSELIVLNKQANITVHPGVNREEKTLVSGLLAYLGDEFLKVGHPERPGIVHRLDRPTSGLMLIAKNSVSYLNLQKQFLPPREIHRTYLALALRKPREEDDAGTIELRIRRHPTKRVIMQAHPSAGRMAKTDWEVFEELKGAFLMKLELHTGRTHQIRAHLSALRAPLIGDRLYGFSLPDKPQKLRSLLMGVRRPMLHAWRLRFKHPRTAKELSFEAELPDDFEQLAQKLREKC